ncbi:MAG TPA: C4-type zinc ribbon domain-containing protein [Candidatus Polarisedimenticolaceae bacterium]|nr:C4-type zinc ribbon domain-containing protein [Candidatus Polarisedimenticolaceae bacterium]
MHARDQLLRLFRLQELSAEIRAARLVVEHAPVRLEEIEQRFRERNAEYVAARDALNEVEADQRMRSGELSELVERRRKYMDDLMQVKNQREYSAMLKEIDAVKAQIAEHEGAVLKDLEESEKLAAELHTHEEHIALEREAVEQERTQVTGEAERAATAIERLEGERRALETGLPQAMLATIRLLEETRQGIFLSRVDHGTCQSCYVRVRPQVFQEIRQATAVHTCSNCRRFLYADASLRTPPGPEAAAGAAEAVNGGPA